jgi:hypothetical protein
MSNAISAQGTLIARAPQATPAVFTNIAELRNITPPALTRNPIETTNHNDLDDSFIVGIRRKGEFSFAIGFLPNTATHDHLTGLTKAWADGTRDNYKITFPDGSTWAFSGYVTSIAPSAPVDDALTADITIRPTGAMTFTVA